jgi:hypothetical protein
VYYEKYDEPSAAIAREKQIKAGSCCLSLNATCLRAPKGLLRADPAAPSLFSMIKLC